VGKPISSKVHLDLTFLLIAGNPTVDFGSLASIMASAKAKALSANTLSG
jgi:hypothetical protein